MGQGQAQSGAPIDAAIIAAFRSVSTAVISDNLQRLSGADGLRPFHAGSPMAGIALTVNTAPGDNLFIHRALDLIKPGDVLVVNGGGNETRALVGEIIAAIARQRGAAGIVVDGAIRDSGVLMQSDFPVFARAANHRGPYKNGPGAINVPVSIGGMVVTPGDIVVADADGVVAFAPALASELLEAARAQEQREAEILASIRAGRYAGAYAK
ncbi:dimethylmenaquinone methyltransferase [Bradyrhizobium sp. SSBR45G]|uniref:RraA family protein n=1 Tax=unclassified Bradyrhizobium TaxID=2631580 RepID=UPI002342B188|nr:MULTISPECIES: RraA family protein [unclassified Bradyrhizobium]GLH75815.1 dimethylmenaquinone methyltransferase [Bradyrhizobium sp. SSBR45G]GLH85052.1 dimethylmenaquinone methyltransferase [Bradyrhizobium sp. SSBR45R]